MSAPAVATWSPGCTEVFERGRDDARRSTSSEPGETERWFPGSRTDAAVVGPDPRLGPSRAPLSDEPLPSLQSRHVTAARVEIHPLPLLPSHYPPQPVVTRSWRIPASAGGRILQVGRPQYGDQPSSDEPGPPRASAAPATTSSPPSPLARSRSHGLIRTMAAWSEREAPLGVSVHCIRYDGTPSWRKDAPRT